MLLRFSLLVPIALQLLGCFLLVARLAPLAPPAHLVALVWD